MHTREQLITKSIQLSQDRGGPTPCSKPPDWAQSAMEVEPMERRQDRVARPDDKFNPFLR